MADTNGEQRRQELEFQLRRSEVKEDRDSRDYRRFLLDFERRSTSDQLLERQFFQLQLPFYCDREQKSQEFLDAENELLRKCGLTFGGAEVNYKCPGDRETDEDTAVRRRQMGLGPVIVASFLLLACCE